MLKTKKLLQKRKHFYIIVAQLMRDTSDVMLVVIFSLISLQLLQGWIGIVTGLVAIPYIIVCLILAFKRNSREKRKEEREKEKHETEMELLRNQLKKDRDHALK